MPELRVEERWAAACISEALGVQVVQHDDGSRKRMHDFDALLEGGRAAVEVTTCADKDAVETWKVMHQDGYLQLDGLTEQWTVALTPACRIRELRRVLPALLTTAEEHGIHAVAEEFRALAVDHAQITPGGQPGRVYLHLDLPRERAGGMVPTDGDSIAEWAGEWLREEQQADVVRKLADAGTEQRHVFAWVTGLSPAPFAVQYLLMDRLPALPTSPPNLPREVTHFWVASTWDTPTGLRWAPECGWQHFSKVTSR